MYDPTVVTPAPDSWSAVFDGATRPTRARSRPTTTRSTSPTRRVVPDEDQARPQHHEPVRPRRHAVRRSRRPAQAQSRSSASTGAPPRGDRRLPQRRHGRRHDMAVPGQHPPGRDAAGQGRRHQAQGGRDRLVGHLDDLVQGQAHPNCMYKWMDYIIVARGQRRRRRTGSARRRSARRRCAEAEKLSRRPLRHSSTRPTRRTSAGHLVLEHADRRRASTGGGRSARTSTTGPRPGPRSRAEPTDRETPTRAPNGTRGRRACASDDAPTRPPQRPARPAIGAASGGGGALSATAGAARAAAGGAAGWLVIAYLGSLAVLFVSSFWRLDPFTRQIVTSRRSTTSERIAHERGLPDHHGPDGRHGALVTVTCIVLAFPSRSTWPEWRRRGARRAGRRGPDAAVVRLPHQGLCVAADPAEGGVLDWALEPFGLQGPASVTWRCG